MATLNNKATISQNTSVLWGSFDDFLKKGTVRPSAVSAGCTDFFIFWKKYGVEIWCRLTPYSSKALICTRLLWIGGKSLIYGCLHQILPTYYFQSRFVYVSCNMCVNIFRCLYSNLKKKEFSLNKQQLT